MALAMTVYRCKSLQRLLNGIEPASGENARRLLSDTTGLAVADVRRATSNLGQLYRCGFLSPPNLNMRPDLDEFIKKGDMLELVEYYGEDDAVSRVACEVDRASVFGSDDFSHLADELKIASNLVRHALRHQQPGVHVLLFGAPGTGKTEFAKLIAKQSQAERSYSVPDADHEGEELSDESRLTRYRAIQAMHSESSSLVIFDEAEGTLQGAVSTAFAMLGKLRVLADYKSSKNKLLEETAKPSIWAVNDIDAIDPAMLRRFSLRIEVKPPPRAARESLVSSVLGGESISDGVLREIAATPSITAAELHNIKRVVQANPHDMVDKSLDMILGKERRNAQLSHASKLPYRKEWLNTSLNVEHLSRRVREQGPMRLGLFGPPGTGKTAFARALAEELGQPLLVRQAADLLDPYVGQTEQNIRRSFTQAVNEQSILLFDEVDSILRERGSASRSYEVSQVNQLLQELERHDGTVILASNHRDTLDAALFRRIPLLIEFKPLRIEHLREALLHAADLLGDNVSLHRQTMEKLAQGLAGQATLGHVEAATQAASFADGDLGIAFATALQEQVHGSTRASAPIGFVH